MSFSPKTPTEEEFFAFDFSRQLSDGETISSAVCTMTVKTGVDANPSAMVSGAATIAGGKVSQKIIGGVADTQYCLKCQATTSLGQKLELFDTLWVRSACSQL